jgi:hypothetical protein
MIETILSGMVLVLWWHLIVELIIAYKVHRSNQMWKRLLLDQKEAEPQKELCKACNRNERMIGSMLCMPCSKGQK